MREVIINENDENQRIDKFILKYMKNLPKSMLYKGFRKNCVKVNGKHIKDGSFVIKQGDKLSLYFKDEFFEDSEEIKVIDYNMDIVYEDENIIIINKEAGIVVHADDKGSDLTLIDAIKSYLYKKGEYNPLNEHSFAPSLCNRLDRNTEGLIIAAKNAKALREINEKIKTREIKKYYLCIVDGKMKKKEDTLISHLTRYEKKVSLSDTSLDNSKLIETKYRVIDESEKLSLLEIELLTGRTHQIRAQMAYIGNPLSGDRKYGSKSQFKNYALCSYRLKFDFKDDKLSINYLSGREFSISPSFEKKFFSQKS